MQTYKVGGAVRDRLLGRPVSDIDWVVVGASVEQMHEAGYRPVGADFPVFLHPKTGEEYALARTERKSGRGYGGFVFHATPDVTLEEDLARRDLTINAMAEDDHGTLYDPYDGQADLHNRVLRHVSPAFAEDPLRVLRVARFAARYAPLGFEIAEETLTLMRQIAASGELQALTAERSWKEIERALMEPAPQVFVQVLQAVDALDELLPGVDCTAELCAALQSAAADERTLPVRWACLTRACSPSAIKALNTRLKAPRECQELAALTGTYAQDADNAPELTPERLLDLLQKFDVYRRPQRFDDFLAVCQCWAAAQGAQTYPQATQLREAAETVRRVDAQPLIARGLTGRELGDALKAARLVALRTQRTA